MQLFSCYVFLSYFDLFFELITSIPTCWGSMRTSSRLSLKEKIYALHVAALLGNHDIVSLLFLGKSASLETAMSNGSYMLCHFGWRHTFRSPCLYWTWLPPLLHSFADCGCLSTCSQQGSQKCSNNA